VNGGGLLAPLATDAIQHIQHPARAGMQALLQERQRMVGIGQHIGLPAEVVRAGPAKARQHVGKKDLEPLLRQCEAGRQAHHGRLDFRIEGAQHPPCRFWHRTRRGLSLHASSS